MRLHHYGEAGPPLIYVPSSGGDEREFERYGMPEGCAEWIDAGRVQVVSVDGRGPHHFWSDDTPPAARIAGYAGFERYVAEELLPWVARATGRDDIAIAGCSYGGHVAANLLFKHPDRIRVACGIGGVYGLWHRLDGHHDEDVYFHTPLEYLPNLEEPDLLNAIRRTGGLVMYAAADDGWLESSLRMATVLRDKKIPHELEVWPSPADHHERWWREQLPRFLDRWFQGASETRSGL
jgi:esterase/lipase superfamily enzyme